MAVADITANNTGTSTSATNKASAYASLTSEQYTKIMLAELTKQDPLKPNDTNTILQNVNSLRSIESNTQLTTKLDALVNQNEMSSASSLIGAAISGISEDNRRVAGVVQSVSRTNTGAVLNLTSGIRVPFKNVDEIVDPRNANLPTDPNAPDNPNLPIIPHKPNERPDTPTPGPVASASTVKLPSAAQLAAQALADRASADNKLIDPATRAVGATTGGR
jgi:flagellar basal-body rod modification protein FlgD